MTDKKYDPLPVDKLDRMLKEFEDDNLHPHNVFYLRTMFEAMKLSASKQLDYGSADDPFANVRANAPQGMEAWTGAVDKAGDKLTRLRKAKDNHFRNTVLLDIMADNQFLQQDLDPLVKPLLGNESTWDAALDLVNYAAFTGAFLVEAGRDEEI